MAIEEIELRGATLERLLEENLLWGCVVKKIAAPLRTDYDQRDLGDARAPNALNTLL